MNGWNREFVRGNFRSQVHHALKRSAEGTISLRPVSALPGAAEAYAADASGVPDERTFVLDDARFRNGVDMAIRNGR
jgi:hypothetical protein